ncbi:hypothetical protein K432DRAFT_442969 [Lepidopterella palustris CBS 459.81]|uniref:C3H1-type domain-containing protein n=1 Tax=Lepidopterella palustris CBS 459.81 TaxID=1314670 RepID=A0A8E2EB34_9PEZI|nr:hypothetical protein K432DRAFT_442969 [Lepidopterella palustris CBS 459.81]
MVVCKYFRDGNCRFGDRCKFEHIPSSAPSGNRFAPLQNDRNQPSRSDFGARGGTQKQWPYSLDPKTVKDDLTTDRPVWPLSAYGPGRDAPRQLIEGALEVSPEEMRLQFYHAKAAGQEAQAVQMEGQLARQAQHQIDNALNNLDGACQYIADGANVHPNRIDFAKLTGPTTGIFSIDNRSRPNFDPWAQTGINGSQPQNPFSTHPSGKSSEPAGWPNSTFGKTPVNSHGFGQPGFSQPSFGRPAAPAAFGQPSGLSSNAGFGKPSMPGQTSAFGQPSVPGQASSFGQPSGPGQTSVWGKPSTPGQTPGFGQPSMPGQASGFGKPAFGQPSIPSGASPFGQLQPTGGQTPNSGPFPGNNQPTSTFGQPSTFGTPSGGFSQQSNPSPFNQPSTGISTNPFNQPASALPTAGLFSRSTGPPSTGIFGQPSTAAPAPNAFNQPSISPSSGVFGQPSTTASNNAIGRPSPLAGVGASTATPQEPMSATMTSPTGPPDGPASAASGIATYTTRDAQGRLTSFKGQPVRYINNLPYYQRHASTGFSPAKDAKENWERIWCTEGRGAANQPVEGRPEEYAGEVGKALEVAYRVVKETGRFPVDESVGYAIMPEVPPRREWVGFDL